MKLEILIPVNNGKAEKQFEIFGLEKLTDNEIYDKILDCFCEAFNLEKMLYNYSGRDILERGIRKIRNRTFRKMHFILFNFPRKKRLFGITKDELFEAVRDMKLSHIETAERLCLAGDTKVQTTRGYIPIKDIKKGDTVFTVS